MHIIKNNKRMTVIEIYDEVRSRERQLFSSGSQTVISAPDRSHQPDQH